MLLVNMILVWLGWKRYKVMLDSEYLNMTVKLDDGHFQSDCVLFTNFRYPCGYSVHKGLIRFWRSGGPGSVVIDRINEWIVVP